MKTPFDTELWQSTQVSNSRKCLFSIMADVLCLWKGNCTDIINAMCNLMLYMPAKPNGSSLKVGTVWLENKWNVELAFVFLLKRTQNDVAHNVAFWTELLYV